MSAPESFIELVRCGLVLPRRNVARALKRLEGVKRPTNAPADYDNAIFFLTEVQKQIAYLEQLAEDAITRTICTCECGHVHYRNGDAA